MRELLFGMGRGLLLLFVIILVDFGLVKDGGGRGVVFVGFCGEGLMGEGVEYWEVVVVWEGWIVCVVVLVVV